MTAVVEPVTTPGWLDARREAGRARFAEAGFPTTRDEEWRFTPVQPIAAANFGPAPAGMASAGDVARFSFGHAEWATLGFVNGRYAAERSSTGAAQAGVEVLPLAEAVRAGHPAVERHLAAHAPVAFSPFTALNTGALADGAFVQVANGVEVERPIHLLYLTTAEAAQGTVTPRNLIVVGREAKVALVESYVTLAEGAAYFTNAVTEVVVGAASWVEHARIQRESEAAWHVGHSHVVQERDSHYRSFSLQMGAAIGRHDLAVRLDASNVEALMYGLYMGHGSQLLDNHTTLYHDHPDCRSWEVYKGVLDGTARGVFNGKIFVKPEAQKTDAKQTNRALLLSDTAKIDTKPQLEIFADDVKCTHGAAVGFLDEIGLFYGRSRGIPADLARRIMTYAFAAEVVDEIRMEPVRAELDRLVRERIGGLPA